MSEHTRRLFVALWPSDELRHAIGRATGVTVLLTKGRVIPPQNFHITLAFLGSTPGTRMDDLQRCVEETVVEPFDLLLGEVSCWKRQELLCLEPTQGHEA